MKTLENIVSSLSRAKKALVIGTLAAVIGGSMALAACDGIPIEVIQTYMPTAAATTPAGKDTPEPEVTYTLAAPATEAPTLEPTYTATTEPTATETSVPSIVVPDLNPYLSGVGEHGAMVCLSPLDSASLDQLVLKANISQNGTIIERNVSAQNIVDKGTCFEMLDTKYALGQIVNLELNASKPGTIIQNDKQVEDLGQFGNLLPNGQLYWYPFMKPLFWQSESNENFVDENHATRDGFYAHDYYFGNGVKGTLVHIPFTLKVLRVRQMKDIGFEPRISGDPFNWNTWIYSPYTGFACILSHQQPGSALVDYFGGTISNDDGYGWPLRNAPTLSYDPSKILTNFGPTDKKSSRPHLHVGCYALDTTRSDFEPFFGYNNHYQDLCSTTPPCSTTAYVEISPLFLEGVVDENK